MKKALLIISLAMIGSAAWGQELVAPQHPRRVPPPKNPKIVVQPVVDGAVQKAVRSRQLLQMINPLAPHEYGDGSECVYYDEGGGFQHRNSHEAHPKGIRLFAFSW